MTVPAPTMTSCPTGRGRQHPAGRARAAGRRRRFRTVCGVDFSGARLAGRTTWVARAEARKGRRCPLTTRRRFVKVERRFHIFDPALARASGGGCSGGRAQASMTAPSVTHGIEEAIHVARRVPIVTVRPGRVKALAGVDAESPRTCRSGTSPAAGKLRPGDPRASTGRAGR